MKRLVLVWMVILAGGAPRQLLADEQATQAAALAERKEAEERYKRLNADVQNLLEGHEMLLKRNEAIQQRLGSLADEIHNLKEENARSSGNFVTREELRKYVEKLKEIDEKREDDKKLILRSIKDFAKLPVIPASVPEVKKPSTPIAAETPDESSYETYTVKPKDRLLEIIAACNADFEKRGLGKITRDQVIKANPNLNPNKVLVGQKIKIPIPPKK